MRLFLLCNIFILSLAACGGFGNSSQLPYDMMMANKGYEELVQENYDQAEAFFDVARSVNPDNPYVLLNLGVVYQNTGRIDEAKRMYLRVIELNPTQRVAQSTDTVHHGKTLADIATLNLRALDN
jgi:tetratricopeptide (TPR) repeat protein